MPINIKTYKNIDPIGKDDTTFTQRGESVRRMAEALQSAGNREYLSPTTIAGFIFARITSNYLQGLQTPVTDLIDVVSTGIPSPPMMDGCQDFLASFEVVGTHLSLLNGVFSPVGVELTLQYDGDGYYVNLY